MTWHQHAKAVAGGADVRVVLQVASECGGPHTAIDAGLHRHPIPTGSGVPGVLLFEVLALGARDRDLVHHVIRAERVTQRIGIEALWTVLRPVVVVAVLDELFDAHVDLGEVGGDELAVHDDAGRRVAGVAPRVDIGVGGVVDIWVVPDAGLNEIRGTQANQLVIGVGFEEEVANVVPPASKALRVIKDLGELGVELVERRCRDRGRDAAWHQRRWVRELAEHQGAHDATDAGVFERLEVDLTLERVHGIHDVFDGLVPVDVCVLGRCLLSEGDELGVRHRHECGRIVGTGEQTEVDRVVVEHLGNFAEVSHDNAKRWRHNAEGLLDRHRRHGGVHATTHTTCTRTDVDGIAWVAALQDDFIATKQHCLRVRIDGFAVLEVERGVNSQCTGDTGDRVDTPLLQAGRRRTCAWLAGVVFPDGLGIDAVRVADSVADLGLAVFVDFDGQVRESHLLDLLRCPRAEAWWRGASCR